MHMELKDQILGSPGCDPVTGKAEGPFISTDVYVQFAGARWTPRVAHVVELAEFIGMVPGDAFDAERAELQAVIDDLHAWQAAAEQDLAELAVLRDAVRQTLDVGADVKNGRIVLRTRRNQPQPNLDAPVLSEIADEMHDEPVTT